MDARTRQRFERMWASGMPLAEIAAELRYSFSTLAQLRHSLGLKKRYGSDEADESPPTPELIRIRCQQEQTNWTETDRRMRWRGQPHTIYSSLTDYGSQPE
jgi:hypothetical protein